MINLTHAAVDDVQEALEYYNSRSTNLGYRFVNEVDLALQEIAKMPLAYGFR